MRLAELGERLTSAQLLLARSYGREHVAKRLVTRRQLEYGFEQAARMVD